MGFLRHEETLREAMQRAKVFEESSIRLFTGQLDMDTVKKHREDKDFWVGLEGEAKFGWGKNLPEGEYDKFVAHVKLLCDPAYKEVVARKETLWDALLRVGFEEETATIFCSQLDIGMVRAKKDDEAFWQDIGGAEWTMALGDGQLAKFVDSLKLICDRDYSPEAEGRLIPCVADMLSQAPDPRTDYWPFPSFTTAEMRLEPAHRRKARLQSRKQSNMRKLKVLSRMNLAVISNLDTELREKEARVAEKQKVIADRKAAEAAEEARIKQAAIDAMGIDALGPRPTDEPGLYHQLVDATETRVPVLDEFRGTERDGTSTGKDSSFHAYAPPMREDLHMDAARRGRAAVHCNRYDFFFADAKARSTAWQGTDATKEAFLRTKQTPTI